GGPRPHTGIHLIIVRRDLAYIIHRHPPVAPNGTVRVTITFPGPGPYRVVVDVYPANGTQTNFQLFRMLRVAGAYHPRPLPPPATAVDVAGYRLALRGASHLRAIEAQSVTVNVTGPDGK